MASVAILHVLDMPAAAVEISAIQQEISRPDQVRSGLYSRLLSDRNAALRPPELLFLRLASQGESKRNRS